jgi:cysteine desulfuration protein SufE
MTLPLYDIAEEFADLLPEERLELLIDFSRELPKPSGRHGLIAGNETCRVQECQTPVYLWVGLEDGKTAIEADVPEKSPTVRGLVSVIAAGISGGDPREVLDLPDDLLPILGLQETLGMTRQAGVRGMLARIKRDLRVALAD